MQHLQVSGAVRPLKWSLGVKWLTGFMQWLLRKAGLFNTHCTCEVFRTTLTLFNTGMVMAKTNREI